MTEHPTADWTAQQFRMLISGDAPHRFLIHDHDSIYSDGVDRTVAAMGHAAAIAASERLLRTGDWHESA